jgi:hypothetical protein
MKSSLRFLPLTLCAISATFVSDAALPARPTPTAVEAGAPRSIAGEFVGTWQNDVESGKLRLVFKQVDDLWTAESTFTYQDAEIPAKASELKIDGAKVELVLDWEIQGAPGHSRLIGEWSGSKIEGIYDSKSGDTTTTGTWSVARK